MNLLHKQIGLDFFIESSSFVSTPIDQIAHEVRDYSYNGSFTISGPYLNQPRTSDSNLPSYDEYVSFLETLARHEIVCYKITQIPINDPETNSLITLINAKVFITNRHKFEQLHKELVWTRISEEKGATSADRPQDLLYYDTSSGEMFFNGVHKTLKKRNKEILDILLLNSTKYVSRKKLNAIARKYSKEEDDATYLTNNAFTNLRKVCGNASTDIIVLNSNGGKLNIAVYPITSQLLPVNF